MGANIYWRAIKKGKDLPVGAPSSFIEAMEAAFNKFPVTLSEADIPVLRGMAAAIHKSERPAIDELIEAIEKHGAIEIYAEW